jgi:hypothetical protein
VQQIVPVSAAPADFSLSHGAPASAFGDTVGTSDRNRTSICREAELRLEIDHTLGRYKPFGFLDDLYTSASSTRIITSTLQQPSTSSQSNYEDIHIHRCSRCRRSGRLVSAIRTHCEAVQGPHMRRGTIHPSTTVIRKLMLLTRRYVWL